MFLLWHGWGVTAAWLRQMSRRLVYQFASFTGEAKVQVAEAVYLGGDLAPPFRADLKLMRAWMVWRALLRMEEHTEAAADVRSAPHAVNLIQDMESMLNNMWAWYAAFMIRKRVSLCREAGEDLSKLAVDGYLKLSRRVCDRPVAELTECKPLRLFTATPCSCTPAFKQRRCKQHTQTNAPLDRGPDCTTTGPRSRSLDMLPQRAPSKISQPRVAPHTRRAATVTRSSDGKAGSVGGSVALSDDVQRGGHEGRGGHGDRGAFGAVGAVGAVGPWGPWRLWGPWGPWGRGGRGGCGGGGGRGGGPWRPYSGGFCGCYLDVFVCYTLVCLGGLLTCTEVTYISV